MALGRAKDWLENLAGFKLLLVAFFSGALGGLAFQPVNFLPALWVSFPAFLVLCRPNMAAKTALALGWFFAFGFYLVGLYWVGISATVDIATFWWFIPIASAGLPTILACFVAPIPWLITRFSKTSGEKVALFIGLWLLHEWLRSWMFTGFPWNLVGYTTSFSLPMIQLASVGGVWLLSALILAAASLPYLYWQKPSNRTIIYLLMSLCIPASMWGYGSLRLNQTTDLNEEISLRLVQADIPQSLKWDPDAAEENLKRHVELSAFEPVSEKQKITVWSESSVPYLIGEDSNLQTYFSQVIPDGNLLITGGNRREIGQEGKPEYFNSLFVLDSEGETLNLYDKVHLVPFGEYVPFSSVLPMQKLTAGLVDFRGGDSERRVEIPSVPSVVPLICYEVIFPGRVVPEGGPRPAWLLNITNDAWFGRSSGPFQHFAMARMRAVEEGLPLVRVSNPGISAIIDPLGRIVQTTKFGEQAAIDGHLPVALEKPTIFAKLRNSSVLILLSLALLAFLAIRQLGSRPESDQ